MDILKEYDNASIYIIEFHKEGELRETLENMIDNFSIMRNSVSIIFNVLSYYEGKDMMSVDEIEEYFSDTVEMSVIELNNTFKPVSEKTYNVQFHDIGDFVVNNTTDRPVHEICITLNIIK